MTTTSTTAELPPVLRCGVSWCPHRVRGESAAIALGWGVWHGTTHGGGQASHVFCAYHRDPDRFVAENPDAEVPMAPWDAECSTCGRMASEEMEPAERT